MSSQSIKNHIVRTGFEQYTLKLKDKLDRAAVEIKAENVMKIDRIVIEKHQGKSLIDVRLYHSLNTK